MFQLKMNIGFDAKRAFLNNTGLGNYSRNCINALSCNNLLLKYFLYSPYFKNNDRTRFMYKLDNAVHKHPQRVFDKMFKSYWRSKSIVKDLIQDNIDVFHGLSNEIPLSIENTNIKSVVTIHDLIFLRYPDLFSKIDKKIYEYKFKSSCIRADKIIAVSKQTKEDIINFFKIPERKIEVVYQGCNKVFQNKINKQKLIKVSSKYNLPESFLLYVGTIEKRKNLLTILKSIKDLENQNLVVVGNGKKYQQECIKYISEYKMSSRIFFLSNISLIELASLYQLAEILIYPSIFEGFGIPIIEALFSRTPVITSINGCFKEAGGPSSIYIDPLSSESIKKSILKIQKSKELKQKMISDGIDYVQNFTHEKISSQLYNIYTKL